jgi:hypothetical protein
MVRVTNVSKAMHLFTREGEVLESFLAAMEYLKSILYSEKDVMKMEHLIASIGVGRKLGNYDWHENNDLPPGWKIGTTAGNKKRMSILSPDDLLGTETDGISNQLKDNGNGNQLEGASPVEADTETEIVAKERG